MSAPPPPSYDDSLNKGPNDAFNNPQYYNNPPPMANTGYGATPYPPAAAPYPTTAPYPGATAPYPAANASAPYPPPNPAPYGGYNDPKNAGGYNTQYSGYPSADGVSPNTHEDDVESGGFTTRGFNDKNVRRLFIRKVFITLGLQLLVTFGIVCLFTFQSDVRNYVRMNSWTYYIAYAFFLSIYITLVCCESVRRKHPHNIILLMIFTLALSYMTGTIASFYSTKSVVIALGTTTVVCFAVIVFSMQTKFDFTKCGGVLFVLSMVLMLFGIITIFTYSRSWYIDVVYGCLGALLFTLFLAFDVQMVMGGKKYELAPEEHILGALQIYIDVVYIFIMLLSIFGRD